MKNEHQLSHLSAFNAVSRFILYQLGKANLYWLIQIRKGEKLVTEARFRCRDCGEIVEKQVRPPVPSLGQAVAYF